uniref:BPTI/Kunitz inhibitor domain-containing protein n=1 Tax=Ditylenchus dipsaci TaxID=166011 RepID=A0A915EL17_9BILA
MKILNPQLQPQPHPPLSQYNNQKKYRRQLLNTFTKSSTFLSFYALLIPEVFCSNKVRLGVITDGGKWVCNPNYVPDKGCKIYSLGLNNQISFDVEIQKLTNYRCSLRSIDKSNISNKTRRALGDKSIEILKIDIEGTELEIIDELLQIDICQHPPAILLPISQKVVVIGMTTFGANTFFLYGFSGLLLLLLAISSSQAAEEKFSGGGDKFVVDCTAGRQLGNACAENAPSRFFYYEHTLGVCQPFIYQGCGGNGNRFQTAEECKKECSDKAVKPAKQSQWMHADECNATHLIPDGKYAECKVGDAESCPKGHKCNAKGICCPTKEYVCSLRDDTGTFAEGIADKPRFAYSDAINTCWRFSYYGAKGNYNNFPNFKTCMAFCAKNTR